MKRYRIQATKLQAVHKRIDSEVRKVKKDVDTALNRGFAQLDRRLDVIAQRTDETALEVAVIGTRIDGLATSTELIKKVGELREYSQAVLTDHEQRKHGSRGPRARNDSESDCAPRYSRKTIAAAGVGFSGIGALGYAIAQLLQYVLERAF